MTKMDHLETGKKTLCGCWIMALVFLIIVGLLLINALEGSIRWI